MFGGIAVEDLNLVTILKVHTAVTTRIWNEELYVSPKIPEFFFGYNVCSSVFSSRRRWIVGVQYSSLVHRIFYDRPLYRKLSGKSRTFPVCPLIIEHLPASIKIHLGTLWRLD